MERFPTSNSSEEFSGEAGCGHFQLSQEASERRGAFVCLAFDVSRAGGVAAENGHGNYQSEDKASQQSKLTHACFKYAGAIGGPDCTFGERGGFQSDHEDTPNAGDQGDDKKWFGDENVRVDGNAHGVEDFDEHQYEKRLVRQDQCVPRNVPMNEGIPKQFSGAGHAAESGCEDQYSEDGINKDFGFDQKTAEKGSEFFFGHKDAHAVEVVEKIVRPGVYNDLYLSKSENVGMGRLLGGYSWRRAIRGSTREARRAGSQHATRPVMRSRIGTSARVHGS